MDSGYAFLSLLALSITPCLGCNSWQSLPIRLFNDAEASNLVLTQARTEAAYLLRSACLEVQWISCPVITSSNQVACPSAKNGIELHILLSTTNPDLTKNSLGVTLLNNGSSRAAVFLTRVQQLAASHAGIIDEGGLLGHVIAHELGHVLLNSTRHSSEGLMRPEFSLLDLKKAAQRQLRFTQAQIDVIRRIYVAQAN